MGGYNRKDYIESAKKARLALQISTIRRSKDMSQEELAEKAGYETKAGIAGIENGNRLPGTGKRDVTDKDIANALDISLDQLWGRKRVEVNENGIPKLTEPEKTALSLFAPMLKAMSKEGRKHLIDTALIILKAEGAEAKWEQTEYQKNRKLSENN